ncbi:MAG: hypothetical protein DSY87_03730 [Methylococcus sp.]|nr:MAG: hypothetical protein DSY87_03730 [Methylococcus sp.]
MQLERRYLGNRGRRKAMIPEIPDFWPRPQGDRIRNPSETANDFIFGGLLSAIAVRPVVIGHRSRYPPSFLERGQK